MIKIIIPAGPGGDAVSDMRRLGATQPWWKARWNGKGTVEGMMGNGQNNMIMIIMVE